MTDFVQRLGQGLTNWLTANPNDISALEFCEQQELINNAITECLLNHVSVGWPERNVIGKALLLQNHLISKTPTESYNNSFISRNWLDLNYYLLNNYITWGFSRNCANAKDLLRTAMDSDKLNENFKSSVRRLLSIK